MSEPLLEIDRLSTWIDTGDHPVRAVDGLSLELRAGETFALLGESGCGKSITALSVMRLLPDAGRVVDGRIVLGGVDLLQLPETEMRAVRGARIGMIFQEPMLSLNPVLTVGAQILEVLERHTSLSTRQAQSKARELLDSVGVPDAPRRLHEFPFQLSGGLRQRVMIAMALACEPELLIADEPTTALDVTIQAQVLELLHDLQRSRGMAMLLITHDLGVVAETAHRVGVMYAGQIVETAPCTAFFADPQHPYSRKLFASLPARQKRGGALSVIGGNVPSLAQVFEGCRFAERCDHAQAPCRVIVPALTRTDGGRSVRCHLYTAVLGDRSAALTPVASSAEQAPAAGRANDPTSSPGPGAILEVSDLRVHFPIHRGLLRRVVGYVRAVDGVTLAIAPGRTLALVGESGCGKTTVGKGVLRLVPPTGGEVVFDGVDLGELSAPALRARRRDMQIVFQDPYSSLNPRMRVSEILDEGMSALGVGSTAGERARRIDALLREVGLDPAAKSRYPHEFSGGQRQRIAIARALAVEPRLIVCDEPTSALDVSVQAQILNLLLDLQRRHAIAYLFITHNMGVVEYLAHEVAVMYLGRIVEQGSVHDVFSAPKHPYTRALLSAVPVPDPHTKREVLKLGGDLPSAVSPPPGCHFNPRCPRAFEPCAVTYPAERALGPLHRVRCHLYDDVFPGRPIAPSDDIAERA
ncbi:MAG: dipeptide ABC transporter ATP-binding protein [Burkholderiales bacterium]|nr:dipeptide ABC transporter ATP-binding protein [Burkholderiales bacterium]